MISLLSQKYEKQGSTSSTAFPSTITSETYKNFTTFYWKTLRRKVAKQFSQSINSIERDVYLLGGFNKQAERYKPEVIMTVNFSKKDFVKLFRSK